MSRQNNWAVSEAPARASKACAKPLHDSEEDPDEQSVPEAMPVAYRRGSARSSCSSTPVQAGSLGPGALEDRHSARATDTMQHGFVPSTSKVDSGSARGGRAAVIEASHEEDSQSTPMGYPMPVGRGSRQPSAAAPPPTLPPPATIPAARPPIQPPAAVGLSPPAPRPRPPAATSSRPPARPVAAAAAAGGWGDMLVEDMDDLGLADDPMPLPRAGAATIRTAGVSFKGTPLAPDVARALCALLWGGSGQPPPSWKQGLFFSQTPGLAYGLVQLEGGPCGVLASVQAYVLANLRSTSGSFRLDPSGPQQHEALIAGLTDMVWQARIGPVAVVAAAVGEQGTSCAALSHDQFMRAVVTEQASTRDQLQELIRQRLSCYMDAHGWGLLLVLLSVILSHGIAAVRDAMDEPSNALMGMHGYCTQELVNLLITGQASSNVFDGHKELDGAVLHGITRRCRVGLLTLFEWYKYVEVGTCLKSPDLPIWVVCSESHFTVLFTHDVRAMRGELPFELQYYDELANHPAPIRLSITRDPRGGWTARVGESFGDRGKCEGQNIPPLECVIETRWPGVKVDWNGTEPIL